MPRTPLSQLAPTEERPSSEDWHYNFVADVTRGLDFSASPRSLDEGYLIKAENIRFSKDSILSDLGYKNFGQVIEGKPRLTYEFFQTDGTNFLLLLTNKTMYSWSSANDEWEFIDGGGTTSLSANEASGQTDISVVSDSGFSDGDLIGIRLNDGTQHRTTVNGAPSGNVITITDALPSAADSGNSVVRPVHLNGSDSIQPTITTWAGPDRLYFTNGVDHPKYFDGTTITDLTGLPTNFKARVVAIHTNHLIFLNTQENGTNFPQRERWSEPGNDASWNTSVNFVDHVDSEDHILSAQDLGVYFIIYKERSIIRQEFVGSNDQTWNWITTVSGEGAVSADSVVNLGEEHIIWGNANIYRYRGGFNLEALGTEVFDAVFSTTDGDLNPNNKGNVFAIYVEEFDEIWFFYPTQGQTYPNRAAKLQISKRAWSFRNFNFDVSGFGFFTSEGSITWETSTGTWEDASGPWIGSSLQTGAPTIHLCDASNLRIYEYDFFVTNDAGSSISYEVETKDWFMPNRELRFDRYDFVMKGASVAIEASFDGGKSYVTLGTVTPGTSFIRERISKQVVGRSVRFRFSGAGSFGLQEIGFLYKRESVQP